MNTIGTIAVAVIFFGIAFYFGVKLLAPSGEVEFESELDIEFDQNPPIYDNSPPPENTSVE